MIFSEEIPSDIKLIPKIISAAIQKIKQLPLSQGQVHDIKLSLEEALANAIKHGNKFNQNLFVRLELEDSPGSLIITVSDQGQGYDFSSLPDPTKQDNLQKLSGRGIFLIRNHMDKVEFLDSGRKIKMTKIFKEEKSENTGRKKR